MSNIPKLKINAEMTSNKIISDDMKKTDGTAYITKEACDGLYKPKNNGEVNVKSINYTPAPEQKIQFSLTEPYTIRFAGWFVVNPDDRAAESWFISINDRPMFHSDSDGNMSVSILVYEGDVITSTTEYDRYGYLMPCESELSDWRDSSLKSDTVDIWKNAVRTDGTVADQWLENTSSTNWYKTHGSTYKTLVSYVNDDEAFDVNGNHLFYIQTENIKTGYNVFYKSAITSFSGDLSSLTNGDSMFYESALASWDIDMPNLTNGDRMFAYSSSLASFSGDLSSLTNGFGMFSKSALQSFNGDLPSLTDGSYMFIQSALQSFSGDLSSLTNGSDMFDGTALKSFSSDLPSLTNGSYMFYKTALTSWNIDLSSLTNGGGMFSYCSSLTSWDIDLPKLTDSRYMFSQSALESFSGNLSSLTNGSSMFDHCSALTSFSSNLSKLTNGSSMFSYCSSLTSFSSNLSKLTNGSYMFRGAALQSFSSNLSKLTNGSSMFAGCKLDLTSVQNIANTINTVTSGKLTLGIQSSLQGNADLNTALTTIRNKKWSVTAQYNS